MALTPGTRLGAYEIVSALGAGGMGEVYRARDTKLGRSVALKVLPNAVARDPDRIARLEREAQSLAALTHPYIATLYGMEEAEHRHFLVMELVEGETLTLRIRRGPIPLAAALMTAIQIADAPAAAHRIGIVHRDLKPDNVMITKGGAKLLDFGIAKATDPAMTGENASLLPTTPPGITEPGAILGTFQYMAPEQIEGHSADARADLFAFGCVVFEMVTGRKAFEGQTPASVVAATLHVDPPPVSTLQPTAPHVLDRVVQKCLAKDRDDRWQSARDLCDALKWIAESNAMQVDQTAPQSGASRIAGARFSIATLVAALFAVAAAAVAAWSLLSPRAVDTGLIRTVIPLSAGTELALSPNATPAVAISPDGRQVAYVALLGDVWQLYLRSLDHLDARAIEGARGARIEMPFFSRDGESLGFLAQGGLMKAQVGGGLPVSISAALGGYRGASWGFGKEIVLSRNNSLVRMSADGGEPTVLTALNVERHERSHRLAQVLPGGRAVLFTLSTTEIDSFDDASIAVLSLDTGEYQVVLKGGTNPHYSPSGHLVYARAGTIFAAPFDLAALGVTGAPIAVVNGVAMSPVSGHAEFSLSRDGSLLYAPGRAWGLENRILWVDRKGQAQPLMEAGGGWQELRISPDGRRLAFQGDAAIMRVWVYDIERGALSRLPFDGESGQPIWTPDSRHVAFWGGDGQSGTFGTFLQPADGSQPAERLTELGLGGGWRPRSFSPDGKMLALETRRPETGWDTYLLRLEGKRTPEPYMTTQADEYHAAFSPDGRWVAYQSNESGRPEVYLRPFQGPSRRWQVSTQGGTQPVWSPKGDELFYRNEDQMMTVDVVGKATVTLGKPKVLFKRRPADLNPVHRHFDISSDGQRFAVIDSSDAMRRPTQLILVQHWAEELKRLVPTK